MSFVQDEFRCPVCDGKKWGTSRGFGTCSGTVFDIAIPGQFIAIPCQFTWARSDDWKYMRTVIGASSETDRGPEIAREAAIQNFMNLERKTLRVVR